MTVLIASDFYTEYELYRTSDPEDLKATIKRMYDGEDILPDETKHEMIGSQDDIIFPSDATDIADEIWYLSDMIYEED